MDAFTQFDGNLLIAIQQALYADWLTPIMKVITYFGEGGYFWMFTCLMLMLFRRSRRLGIICTLSLFFTFLCCNMMLKPLIDRTRPWVVFEAVNRMMPDPGDAAFPSGHSANAMAPAWAMFLATLPVRTENGRSYDAVPCLGWKRKGESPRLMHRLAIGGVVLAVLIGISRNYLGMHYPSDVVCGLLLGMIVATIVYKVVRWAESRHGIIGKPHSKTPDVLT